MVPASEEGQGDIPVSGIEFKTNHCYLIKEKRTIVGYKELKRLQEAGFECLCITRNHPLKIKEKYDLNDIRYLWLTGNRGTDYESLAPEDVSRLSSIINRFMIQNPEQNKALLLDHVEYLIVQNSFQTLLRVIHMIRDKIMIYPVILLLPMDPFTVEPKELRLLERECEVVDTKDY